MHSHHSPFVFDLVQAHLCLCSRDDSSGGCAAACFVEAWLLCRRMELELLSVSVVSEVLRFSGETENMFAFSSSLPKCSFRW